MTNMNILIRLLASLLFILPLLPSSFAAQDEPVFQTTTDRGLQIEIYSAINPLQINQIHSWRIRVLDANGALQEAEITLTGGMPEHDHGMPTSPRITQQLDNGDYLLEGVRFHMPGLWVLLIEATVNNTKHTATIEFRL